MFIWLKDKMLFTLTTLKKNIGEWGLMQRKIKRWSTGRRLDDFHNQPQNNAKILA